MLKAKTKNSHAFTPLTKRFSNKVLIGTALAAYFSYFLPGSLLCIKYCTVYDPSSRLGVPSWDLVRREVVAATERTFDQIGYNDIH